MLIVDDDTQVSRLVAELIRDRAPDVSLEIANDGFEAGAKVESFRPHALVLDLMMPGMDGFEVCRRLRARPTLNHIRIVAMTGDYTPENVATHSASRRQRVPGEAFRFGNNCSRLWG